MEQEQHVFPVHMTASEKLPAPLIEETVAGGTTTTYVGMADIGTKTSDKKWYIRRIVSVVAGFVTTTTTEYVGGKTNNYVSAWDDRATLKYAR